jgi:hypothetical protein
MRLLEYLIDITLLSYTIYKVGGFHTPVRKRPKVNSSFDEREEISRGLTKKCSIREIARMISRALFNCQLQIVNR